MIPPAWPRTSHERSVHEKAVAASPGRRRPAIPATAFRATCSSRASVTGEKRASGRIAQSSGRSPPTPITPPAYDNYLLGYRTRENSVPAAYQSRVWPGGGIIRPTVVADGLVIGTWSRKAGAVHIDAFEPFPARIQRALSPPPDAGP